MPRRFLPLAGLIAATSFLLGLVVAGTRPAGRLDDGVRAGRQSDRLPLTIVAAPRAGESEDAGDSAHIDARPAGVVDFAAVAAGINAAVVNVDTATRNAGDRTRFTRRFSSGDVTASGSGFVIDPAGFILTNHHVVAGADRVTVTLSDGRPFRATVVGVDPAIDVALLHIDAGAPLPVAPLGDSDTLRVGEWVCAIGNPLGVYVHSVTVGVVSFLGRKLWDEGLDAFIQTDAAIALGSSGGPLINARGEVVGITTAVSAQASNIGFAVPISQVIDVLPQLREHGRVARGFIGIGLTSLTASLRQALRIDLDYGALVQDVTPGTPADAAGLRAYDVIVEADGRKILTDEELTRYIAGRAPGTLATLRVWRGGATRDVQVKLRDRPLADAVRRRTPASGIDDSLLADSVQFPLGLRVVDLDVATRTRLRIPETVQGVRVAEVDPAGPAKFSPIRINHVILEINRRRVTSAAEYRVIVNGLGPGDAAALLVYDRSNGQRFIYSLLPDAS